MNPSINPLTMGVCTRIAAALCTFFALLPAHLHAQTSEKITLVADLEKGPGSMIKSSFVEYRDALYFINEITPGTYNHGQLWRYDGVKAEKVIRPGYNYHIDKLIAFNDNLYLSGRYGIYRYDGEKLDTLKEFTVIQASDAVLEGVTQCFIFQDRLYFLIKQDAVIDRRLGFYKASLWAPRGDTLERVTETPPLKTCFEHGGILYGENERALFRFTGTAFERISSADNWSKSVPYKRELVFASHDSLRVLRHGKVTNVVIAGKPPRYFAHLVVYGDACYALGEAADGTAQFWKYENGKANRIIHPSAQALTSVWSLATYKGKLFFSGQKNAQRTQRSLFMFDGNAVTEVLPGANAVTLFVSKETLFFSAETRVGAVRTLHRFNEGKAERISPDDPLWSFEDRPFAFRDELYFVARDEDSGARVWKYDGKKTFPVIETNTYESSNPGDLTVVNNKLYFSTNKWLYEFDGKKMNILGPAPLTGEIDRVSFGKEICFSKHQQGQGYELWKLAGNVHRLVADVRPGERSFLPHDFTWFKDTLFFAGAGADNNNTQLYTYDGARIRRISDFEYGGRRGGVEKPQVVNNNLYFWVRSDIEGYMLCRRQENEFKCRNRTRGEVIVDKQVISYRGDIYFKTTLPTTGHAVIKPGVEGDVIVFSAASNPWIITNLVVFRDQLLMTVVFPDHTTVFLAFDGDNTRRLDIVSPGSISEVKEMIVFNDNLYFSGIISNGHRKLLKFDGEEIRAMEHPDPNLKLTNFSGFCIYNNELYFSANSAEIGTELWKLTD